MFAPSLTPDTTRAVAASTLPLALSNAILMLTLRQQAMLTEQISRSLARSYRASHREAPLPNKQSRLACMAFSDSLALGHDWTMQNIEGQKEGIRLLAKACGEPTWLTPVEKILDKEAAETSHFFTELGRKKGGLAYMGR